MTLDQLKAGEKAVIISIDLKGAIGGSLAAMGLTQGAQVTLLQKAPLGDPLWLLVRGYQLVLRKEYAARITVDITGEDNE